MVAISAFSQPRAQDIELLCRCEGRSFTLHHSQHDGRGRSSATTAIEQMNDIGIEEEEEDYCHRVSSYSTKKHLPSDGQCPELIEAFCGFKVAIFYPN